MIVRLLFQSVALIHAPTVILTVGSRLGLSGTVRYWFWPLKNRPVAPSGAQDQVGPLTSVASLWKGVLSGAMPPLMLLSCQSAAVTGAWWKAEGLMSLKVVGLLLASASDI